MSLSAAVIDALLATGATREQIAAAMKADIAEREAEVEARKEAKREGSRRRQQNKRERDRNAESRDVTTVTRDERDTPSPLSPPLKNPPDPQKYTPPLSPQPEDSSAEPTAQPLTADEVVEAWNERMAPQGFPAVRRLTGTRLRHLKARLRENTIDEWQQAMAALERSAFCRGENDRGWRADFDFLLQPKSFTKLLEGAYDH